MLGKQGHEKQLQLLIVILPEVSGSYGMHMAPLVNPLPPSLGFLQIYVCGTFDFAGEIKKVCETDLGIVSQCCLPRHAARPNKQYMENVALKINVKVT